MNVGLLKHRFSEHLRKPEKSAATAMRLALHEESKNDNHRRPAVEV
jgi:hypothetical protein